MRRDKNDVKWQEVKKRVTKRDRNKCRFLGTLSFKEMLQLQKLAPRNLLARLDHAHIFPVSLYPRLCYMDENIVLLNRFSHHNLDDCKNPVTGEAITREEQEAYWKRIIGHDAYERLISIHKGEKDVTKETNPE